MYECVIFWNDFCEVALPLALAPCVCLILFLFAIAAAVIASFASSLLSLSHSIRSSVYNVLICCTWGYEEKNGFTSAFTCLERGAQPKGGIKSASCFPIL